MRMMKKGFLKKKILMKIVVAEKKRNARWAARANQIHSCKHLPLVGLRRARRLAKTL